MLFYLRLITFFSLSCSLLYSYSALILFYFLSSLFFIFSFHSSSLHILIHIIHLHLFSFSSPFFLLSLFVFFLLLFSFSPRNHASSLSSFLPLLFLFFIFLFILFVVAQACLQWSHLVLAHTVPRSSSVNLSLDLESGRWMVFKAD